MKVAGRLLLCVLAVAAPLLSQTGTGVEPRKLATPVEVLPGVEALQLLRWDDGTAEASWGGHIFQAAVRFGGAPTTITLLPMRLEKAYFRLYPLLVDPPDVLMINIWHPLTPGGFPQQTAPVGQFPTEQDYGTQSVTLGGTLINTPQAGLQVGLGAIGAFNGYYPVLLYVDTDGPPARRQFMGIGATTALSLGPTTLSSTVFPFNWMIQLLVDGNVPVELERFTIDR